MLVSFSVKPKTRVENILLFNSADLSSFSTNVIPLFGPNGIGKSTLIKSMMDGQLELNTDRPTQYFSYCNSTDNFKHREARSINESFDPFLLNAKFDAQSLSEGQSIIYSMFDLLEGFYPQGELSPVDDYDYLILLDEIDSGLSIDNIDTTMRKIQYIMRTRNDVQIMFSFNSPRILKWFPEVLSMYDGTKLTLHTDEDMIKEIRKHKKEFDKLRKNSKGRPKVVV